MIMQKLTRRAAMATVLTGLWAGGLSAQVGSKTRVQATADGNGRAKATVGAAVDAAGAARFESGTKAKADVLMRGPIHEAFARPTTIEPIHSQLIKQQPPKPVEEVLPNHRPAGQGVMWIPGYWAFDDQEDDFLWISGIWRKVPPGRTWVPGFWEQAEQGYYWRPGAWVRSDASVAYQARPPKSLERGPSSGQPSRNHFYVPGNWVLRDGEYKWRPGSWTTHQQNWVWTPASYTPTAKGYLYSEGYWDYRLSDRGRMFAPIRFANRGDAKTRLTLTPNVALDNGNSLLQHLFASTQQRQYYFGDYYADGNAQRGIVPWFEQTAMGNSLLSYIVWRNGDDFVSGLQRRFKFFTANADMRPRATFAEHLALLSDRRSRDHLEHLRLGATLDSLVSGNAGDNGLVPLTSADRNTLSGVAKQLGQLSRQRVDLSANAAVNGGAAIEQALQLPELPGALIPALPQTLPTSPLGIGGAEAASPLPGVIPKAPLKLPRLPF